jgi:hypothetical protein
MAIRTEELIWFWTVPNSPRKTATKGSTSRLDKCQKPNLPILKRREDCDSKVADLVRT